MARRRENGSVAADAATPAKNAGSATGRRRHPLPEGIEAPPRHQEFTGAELMSRFVSSESGEAFSAIAEDSTVNCRWRCAAGHEYTETRAGHRHSRGCPVCATSIATRMPGLLRFWDEACNAQPATDVSAYSREPAHWVCEHGHHFERPPYRVLATGHQCRECRRAGYTAWNIAGKAGPASQTLADARPDVAAQWDYERNARGPEEYSAGSQRVAYWICENGHSWSSPICHRTSAARHPASCQKCKAIAFAAPELAAELHPTLNPKDIAYRVRKGSSEVLYWQCERGHVYSASVASRLRSTYPAGCDRCRSIAVRAPDLVRACWAYELNGNMDPELQKPSSSQEVWWVRVGSIGVPTEARSAEDFERKRIGYRLRRYLNNPQREGEVLRRFLAERDAAEERDEAAKASSGKRRRRARSSG